MTKSLTEKWKDGELPNGCYYVKDWNGTTNRFTAQNNILWRDSNNPIYASERIEVLAPVPSYSEYQALKDNCETIHTCWKGAKEKINKLQEQLKEANEVISDLSEYPPINPSTRELSNALNRHNAKKYLEKWGVK